MADPVGIGESGQERWDAVEIGARLAVQRLAEAGEVTADEVFTGRNRWRDWDRGRWMRSVEEHCARAGVEIEWPPEGPHTRARVRSRALRRPRSLQPEARRLLIEMVPDLSMSEIYRVTGANPWLVHDERVVRTLDVLDLVETGVAAHCLPDNDPPYPSDAMEAELTRIAGERLEPWFSTIEAAVAEFALPVGRLIDWNRSWVDPFYGCWVGVLRLRKPGGTDYPHSIVSTPYEHADSDALQDEIARDWGAHRLGALRVVRDRLRELLAA